MLFFISKYQVDELYSVVVNATVEDAWWSCYRAKYQFRCYL